MRFFNEVKSQKCLQFHVTNKRLRKSQAYQKCLNHLLFAEINKNQKVLVKQLSSVKSPLIHVLNFSEFNVCNKIINNNKKSILKCKYTHNNKLSDLIPG